MRKLRVLVATDRTVAFPDTIEGLGEKETAGYKTEYDVVTALKSLGHEPRLLSLLEDLGELREAIDAWKPHIVFNLMEGFHGLAINVAYILGYLELRNHHYTGCNPNGLLIADNKALMKRILRYHRIPVPEFTIFRRGKALRCPKRLMLPAIVKTTSEHGSIGIAQASVVSNVEKLLERVRFIHQEHDTDAVAETYIEGREFYVGVVGNHRLETFPLRELHFENLPEGAPRIMTHKAKWDVAYRERIGVGSVPAKHVPKGTEQRIHKLCKRVYRLLGLSGYARMDVRLTSTGKIYFLEPNPNAELTADQDFAKGARAKGISYDALVQRILNLGLRYRKERTLVW
jgi:D-alanine-D-alanine ligase